MNAFENQGLSPEILRAIGDMGFESPTPIQQKVIPAIISDSRDIIGLAQTGTGKTAGFGLPIIQQVDQANKDVQALILCPTRELCLQITGDFRKFAKYLDKIFITAVYGGTSISNQIREVKRGAHIIVGTPGRTLDLIHRHVLKIGSIRWLVLDEADEMLNMGFRDELDAILSATPEEKQVLLFSATMPEGVRHIAGNYMKNPVEIIAGKKNTGAENVVHHVYHVKSVHRFQALKRLIDIHPDMYGIVFCRTRNETRDLADRLTQEGYDSDALHGDLSQAQRDQVMKKFRTRKLKILVATDVAARGIDVNDLTHVINYSLPDDPEVYVHRSGRTGRAGKAGISVTLVNSGEMHAIRRLEKLTGKNFEKQLVPDGKDIYERKLQDLLDKIENADGDDARLESLWEALNKRFAHLTAEDLIKKLAAVEFGEFLGSFGEIENLNAPSEDQKHREKGKERTDFERFHVNIGRKHNLNPNRLMGLINEQMNGKNVSIGKIEIYNNFSFIEIEKERSPMAVKSMNNAVFGDISVKMMPSKPRKEEHSSKAEKPARKNKISGSRKKENTDFGKAKRRKSKKQTKAWWYRD